MCSHSIVVLRPKKPKNNLHKIARSKEEEEEKHQLKVKQKLLRSNIL